MNMATIDLDEPTEEDLKWVRGKISEFVEETGSEVGKDILNNWQKEHASFVKVSFCFWFMFLGLFA